MNSTHHTAELNANAAMLVIQTLRANGIDEVVVSPGSRSTPLVLAASRLLKTTVILDERVAGFYALGRARAGVGCALLCTSGTAGAHYLPAIIEASQTRTPLVAITADRPPELQDCGAPQTIRQEGLYGAHVRYHATLPVPESASSLHGTATLTLRALTAAFGSPPGPVHLNIPLRKPLWEPHVVYDAPPSVGRLCLPARGVSGLDRVEKVLGQASRPALFLGPHTSVETVEAALRFGAHHSIPVLTELSPPEHNIAHLDLILRSKQVQSSLVPDVLIHIGHGPIGRQVLTWMSSFSGTRISLDADGWTYSTSGPFDLLWTGDVTRALAALMQCSMAPSVGWLRRWTGASEVASQEVTARVDTLSEPAIASLLASKRPGIHIASSMPIRDVAAFARPVRPTYSRGANGIDGTVATALGLGARTVLIGDLALRHDIGGLATAVELGADLDIICIDNAGGGIFHLLPIARHESAFEPYFATPQSVDLARLAGGTGADVLPIRTAAELTAALEVGPVGVRVLLVTIARDAAVEARQSATEAVVQALDSEGAQWHL